MVALKFAISEFSDTHGCKKVGEKWEKIWILFCLIVRLDGENATTTIECVYTMSVLTSLGVIAHRTLQLVLMIIANPTNF